MRFQVTLARSLALGVTVAAATALAVGSSFASTDTAAAPAAPASKAPKPTVVLVHGAFAGSSSWDGVVTDLTREGYPVVAAANPLRDVASDAAAVRALVESIKGPVVLVGHSYGGSVITDAATGERNVKSLVYVAAFVPEKGETALGLTNKFPGSTLAGTLQQVPLPNGDNDLYVRQDLFPEQFAGDVPLPQARVMGATQRPVTDTALNAPTVDPAWHAIPSWAVYGTADKNIPPAAHRFMTGRAHARTTVVPGASHVVMVSHPDVVAHVIEDASR